MHQIQNTTTYFDLNDCVSLDVFENKIQSPEMYTVENKRNNEP
jgi:hypothetical protein